MSDTLTKRMLVMWESLYGISGEGSIPERRAALIAHIAKEGGLNMKNGSEDATRELAEKWAREGGVKIMDTPRRMYAAGVTTEEIEQKDKRIADLEHALSIVHKWAQSPYGEGVVPSSVWAVVKQALKVHE